MKTALFIFILLLSNTALAGGGKNTNVPDNFLEVIGFILFFAIIIETFKKL